MLMTKHAQQSNSRFDEEEGRLSKNYRKECRFHSRRVKFHQGLLQVEDLEIATMKVFLYSICCLEDVETQEKSCAHKVATLVCDIYELPWILFWSQFEL